MRRYLRRAIPGFLLFLFFAATLGLPLFGAFAPSLFPKFFTSKYYDSPEVIIDATVHPDGSLTVVERRTFDYQKGRFSFAFREIEHRQPGDIVDFRVQGEHGFEYLRWQPGGPTGPLDPGVLEVDDSETTLKGTWHFVAQDQRRTFVISFTALCAVTLYDDGAHLYWQFLPAGFDKPTGHARITIHLPPASAAAPARPSESCSPEASHPGGAPPTTPLRPDQVRAWGHGPLQGNVSLPDPQTVVLDVRHVRPFQFAEASILFPVAAVPLEGPTGPGYGPDPEHPRVTSAAEVLDQEVRLANHANAVRRWLNGFEVSWRTLAVLYPLFLLALVLIARRRDRVPGVPNDTQEPPEAIHPVDLAVLWGAWHRGTATEQNAYRAELLWLAKTGVIEVQAEGQVSRPKDINLVLRDLPSHPYDQEFTEYLFAGESVGPVQLSKVKGVGKRAEELRDWVKLVTKQIGWQRVKRHRRWESRAMWIALAMFVVVGITSAAVLHRASVAWVLAEAFVLWAVARWFLPPRLPEDLRERVAKWAAFRRFLKRFSSLPDAPAMAIVIWEQYLAYATALAVARRVAKQVKAVLPAEQVPAPWTGAPAGLSGLSWASTISIQTPVAASLGLAATSSSGTSWSHGGGSFSSSTGFSSGGFSSGGGHGGGGGSVGSG